jgi:hypothetical protein
MFVFPLVLIWPFVDLTWWQAFLPVGLIPFGAVVVIPLALLFKADMKTFPLYGNKEEGYPEWFDRYVQNFWYKKLFPRWWWYSIRNPLNNMRFLFDDDKEFKIEGWQEQSMEAHNLIIAGVTSATRWSYRGGMAGWRRVWLNGDDKYSEVWFGWKVGSTVPGLGFATQVRLKRDIGT